MSLTIGLMATMISEQYRDQIKACRETWIPKANALGIRVLFFVGSVTDPVLEDGHTDIIHLDGVRDDYESATFKHWYGLRWMLLNNPSDFYFLGGSDNYVHVDRMLTLISKYRTDDPLLISGYNETRIILGQTITFGLGGSGIIFNHQGLVALEPSIEQIIRQWHKVHPEGHHLRHACDVATYYHGTKLGFSSLFVPGMHPCSWIGLFKGCPYPYGAWELKPETLITCHFMEPIDQHLFDQYPQDTTVYRRLLDLKNLLPTVTLPSGLRGIVIEASEVETLAVVKRLIEDYRTGPKKVWVKDASKVALLYNGKLGLTVSLLDADIPQEVEAIILGKEAEVLADPRVIRI